MNLFNKSKKIQSVCLTLIVLMTSFISSASNVQQVNNVDTLEQKLTSSQTDNTLTLSLANTLPTKNDVSVSSMQIGLANIRDCLHLLYGNKASFNTQVKDNLFIATLELPKESRC